MDPYLEKTRAVLRKVRQIEIRTRHLLTDAMVGAYHSVFKGQGMDFEEVREYAPGDEVRSIDWNVTAKMNKPFLKTFREERELTLLLLVDLSESGSFGSNTQSKRERAAELASLLAFSASSNNDKVGLILFTDQVEKVVFPKKGKAHILRIVRDILFTQPKQAGTDIGQAMAYVSRVLKRKAIVLTISDFLDDSILNPRDHSGLKAQKGTKQRDPLGSLKIVAKRHDLICFQVSDPVEQRMPAVGPILIEDLETGAQVEINTSASGFQKQYQQQNRAREDTLKQTLRKLGADLVNISTDGPYIAHIERFFKKRMGRR